jgi:hypothetical protein
MTKKRRRIVLVVGLLMILLSMAGIGLKYFPFSKLIQMPARSEQEMVISKISGHPAPNTIYYDFELPEGDQTPGGFYKGNAHSGQYSVKAFGKNSFSYAVERTAASVGLSNLGAVALSAWIYVFPTDKEVKGAFVFTASNELGVNLTWQGVSLVEPEIPRGKWFKISGYYDLKHVKFNPETKLQIYFWNTSSADILIDDYFISFGGPVDRRGDSALVDLTRPGGYVARFNYPPFPVSYLTSIADGQPVSPQEFSNDDITVSGDFFGAGCDGLLVVKQNGTVAGFTCCRDQGGLFIGQGSTKPGLFNGKIKAAMAGRFTGSSDQLLIQTDKQLFVCSVAKSDNPCTSSIELKLKVLSSHDCIDQRICAGRFSGAQHTELLLLEPGGGWTLMALSSSDKDKYNWKSIAKNDQAPFESWNSGQYQAGLTAGFFTKWTKADQLLAVTRKIADGTCEYQLLRFNPGKKQWESVFRKGRKGVVVGIDTLRPEDKFYLFDDEKAVTKRIFRYNREWRFDLKEIIFNDSTYQIVSNLDFSGYSKDQNPKYYESLILVGGDFSDRSRTSVLVVGKNKPDGHARGVLPDFTHFYGLSTAQ